LFTRILFVSFFFPILQRICPPGFAPFVKAALLWENINSYFGDYFVKFLDASRLNYPPGEGPPPAQNPPAAEHGLGLNELEAAAHRLVLLHNIQETGEARVDLLGSIYDWPVTEARSGGTLFYPHLRKYKLMSSFKSRI
jgi:hypothetical protein